MGNFLAYLPLNLSIAFHELVYTGGDDADDDDEWMYCWFRQRDHYSNFIRHKMKPLSQSYAVEE